MACDKPNGDCTDVSPCGSGCSGCGGGTASEPVLPRCQDVQLMPGTYANATIVVNAAGCISAVSNGEPPLYTPDDCCGQTTPKLSVAEQISASMAAVFSAAPTPVMTADTSALEAEVARLNNLVVDLEARLAALEGA